MLTAGTGAAKIVDTDILVTPLHFVHTMIRDGEQ
jgi:hypothetical protein